MLSVECEKDLELENTISCIIDPKDKSKVYSNLYLSRKYNKFTLGVSSSKEELVKILLSLKGYNYDPSRNQTSSS